MNLLNLFKDADRVESVAAGAIVFNEGDPGAVMYVVLDGELELQVGGRGVESVGPGDIIGEMALIDAKLRSATARAVTDCRLCPVDDKQFLFLVQQTPYFSLHVMRVLADRLRHMDARWTG